MVGEFLEARKGRSEKYLKDLRLRLCAFAEAFHCDIADVSGEKIEEYLDGLLLSPRTRNNHRAIVGSLFQFARKRHYVPRAHPGVSEIEKEPGGAEEEIQVFGPDELAALLKAARPEIVPFLAVAAFAGIRHEELLRLDWADVKFEDNVIQVRARNAKTKVRRLAPIPDNLRDWLLPHAKSFGPITPFANMSKQLMWLADAAKVPWRHNGLRHSFCSFRLAAIDDLAKVALEAGNSPQILRNNYLKLVTRREAERYFNIRPEGSPNILTLPAAGQSPG